MWMKQTQSYNSSANQVGGPYLWSQMGGSSSDSSTLGHSHRAPWDGQIRACAGVRKLSSQGRLGQRLGVGRVSTRFLVLLLISCNLGL